MATPYSVAVIVGSLRKESFSLKIANALAKLAPDTLKLKSSPCTAFRFSIRIWKPHPRRIG